MAIIITLLDILIFFIDDTCTDKSQGTLRKPPSTTIAEEDEEEIDSTIETDITSQRSESYPMKSFTPSE